MLWTTPTFGTPDQTGECRACGDLVGWVQLGTGQRISVNLEPKRLGTIAVLADAWRAVDLQDEVRVSLEERQAIMRDAQDADGPLFVRHSLTCPARGMRWAGWTAPALVTGHLKCDTVRESRRAARLAAYPNR
jgi:hypothetical protein